MVARQLLVAGILAAFARTNAAESWWRVLGETQKEEYSGGHVDDGEKLDEEQKAFLATETFAEWESYEDELVRLAYPKNPLLKLEVKGGADGIKVEGGVCTTVDNSFSRAYVLKVGEVTYGVFLLANASWLDDGVCFCGPMVHHVYRVEDGCLARFSLLPGGAVKKAQLLGGKLRLMAFEWTHMACPRTVYEEMVERMTLKIASSWSEERLRDEVFRRYGMEGHAGWLHPGTSVSMADEIMARPSSENEGKRVWLDVMDNYPCKLEARFEKGLLVKIEANGVLRTGEEAVRGSLDWAEDRLEMLTKGSRRDDRASDQSEERVPKPTPEQLSEIVEAVVAQSKKVPEDEWWRCVSLMAYLSGDHGVRDERFTQSILARGKGSSKEIEVLQAQKHAGLNAWIVGNLKAMRTETLSGKDRESFFDSRNEERATDAEAMIEHLAGQKHPQTNELAAALFNTNEPAWLLAAIRSVQHLEPELAQKVIHEGLKQAIAQQSARLLEVVFDQLKSVNLKNPAEISALIDQLPSGEAGDGWETEKADARKALSKMGTVPPSEK